MKEALKQRYNKIKYIKLLASIVIDLIGNATYFLPVVGEGGDLVWGFLSGGLLMFALYPNHKIGATLGGLEELIPGTDIVPTATLLWLTDYVMNKQKTFESFVRSELDQDQIIDEIVSAKTKQTQQISKDQ